MGPGDFAAIFVLLLRTLIPFTILRWPLAGGIASMLSDAIDVMIFEAFGAGFLSGLSYHKYDKTFDTFYLFIEFLVVRKWSDKLARKTGSILFAWRFLGFAAFMLFSFRAAFFFAPNIFEYFFITMLIIWKFNKKFKLNIKKLVIILFAIGIPSIIKEYLMHFKYPDQTWAFWRDHLFWWLYK